VIKTAHWFTVNHSLIDENDNEDPHTLACFLGLTYHEYIHLLEACCLTNHVRSGKQQGDVCVSALKLKQFVQTIPNTDFSHRYSLFFGNTYTQYHVVCLGGSPNASFSFAMQLKLKAQNKCCTPLFCKSSLHLVLFEALDDLHYCQSHPFPETALTESDLLNSPNTPSFSPPQEQVQLQFDTALQLQCGAQPILEMINMKKDFPYLHSLGITIDTDFNVRWLQHLHSCAMHDTVPSVSVTMKQWIYVAEISVWDCLNKLFQLWGWNT